jgi:hypothetical protein
VGNNRGDIALEGTNPLSLHAIGLTMTLVWPLLSRQPSLS